MLAALVPLALGAGCKEEPTTAPTPPPLVLSPVPAPAGLVAELCVPAPEALWNKLRIVVGGGSVFLPKGFGALVSSLFGVPITVAGELDTDVPTLGALVDLGPDKEPLGVLALHVKDGGRFVDQLTLGDGARFRARLDEGSGIKVLGLVNGQAPHVLAVLGNYLLVGKTEAALLAVGPYVVRTLPTQPVPKEDLVVEVPESAFAGPLAARSKATWDKLGEQRKQAGASDPAALVSALFGLDASQGLGAVLANVARARLTLRMGSESAELRVAATPKPGANLGADLTWGDGKPLLTLPRDTQVAALLRGKEGDDAALRARAASLVAVLTKGRESGAQAAMEKALAEVNLRPPSELAFGFALTSTGPAGYARGPLADAKAMENSLVTLGKVLASKDAKTLLEGTGREVTFGKTVLENLPGEVFRLRFANAKKDGKTPPSAGMNSVDVLAAVRGSGFFAATGAESRDALRRLLDAEGDGALGASPEARAAVERLGSDVAFALVAEPLALLGAWQSGGGDAPSAPVSVSIGRDGAAPGAALWLRIDAANAALREAGKLLGAP
jgi:hypothetical protein